MFAGLKQIHKVIREKDTCPKFCDGADLRFQGSMAGPNQGPTGFSLSSA